MLLLLCEVGCTWLGELGLVSSLITQHASPCLPSQVIVTGKKAHQKFYKRHSGRPGGMTVERFSDLQQRIPERIVEKVQFPFSHKAIIWTGTLYGLAPGRPCMDWHQPSMSSPPNYEPSWQAIYGMLPKNSHGRELFRHLKVHCVLSSLLHFEIVQTRLVST